MNKFLEIANKIGKDKIMLMALAGIVLIICSGLDTKEKNSNNSKLNIYGKNNNSTDYITNTEQKLQEMISSIEGVGACKVMITLKSYDSNKSMITTSEKIPAIEGILVIINGADNPSTTLKINDVIQSLFDVEMHKISIVEMK